MVAPQAARARRQARLQKRLEWFGERVANDIRLTMGARLRVAAQLARDQVVINISIPVQKYKTRTGRTGVVRGSRSKPGEFPRADTTRLMKDIYWEVDGLSARVGTTLDYGLILETKLDRSFLERTLREMQNTIRAIMLKGRGGATRFRLDNE